MVTHGYRGKPPSFDSHARVTGPCGDTMDFWLSVDADIVRVARFETDGCRSSSACGNMACALAEGKPLEDAMDVSQQMILDALGGMPEDTEHCALLASNTLKEACEDYWRRLSENKTIANIPHHMPQNED